MIKTEFESIAPVLTSGNERQEGAALGSPAGDATASEMESAKITRAAKRRAEDLCHFLFPGGRRRRRGRDWYWVVGSPEGKTSRSLTIKITGRGKGKWRDGASKDMGTTLIQLWRWAKECPNLDEAAVQMKGWLEGKASPSTLVGFIDTEHPVEPPGAAVLQTGESQAGGNISGPVAGAAENSSLCGAATRIHDALKAGISPSEVAPISEELSASEREEYHDQVHKLKAIQQSWEDEASIIRNIRDRALYRAAYKNFGTFCRVELGMTRTNADRLCQTAALAKELTTNVVKPMREAHIRPLLRLTDTAEQVRAFQQAVDQAKKQKKPLTAVFVTRAVREILEAKKSVHVDQGPSEADVITQIRRDFARGLENWPLEQLQKFATALADFKESWLKAHPPADESVSANLGGQSR